MIEYVVGRGGVEREAHASKHQIARRELEPVVRSHTLKRISSLRGYIIYIYMIGGPMI